MTIKTFRGKGVQHVLAQIREEVGRDAMIVGTRTTADQYVEIAIADASNGHVEGHMREALCSTQESLLEREARCTEQIERSLQQIMDTHGVSPELQEQIAAVIVKRGAVGESVTQRFAAGLEGVLRFDPRLREGQRVVTLVGTTGVGKTTTIAKLTAQLQAAFGVQIGIIAADLFRVGAGEQMREYANLLGSPFALLAGAKSPAEELRFALQKLSHCDLIFIDTNGVSPRDQQRIRELAHCLSSIAKQETLLVLPAPLNTRDAEITARAFAPLHFERVILSKLDESAYVGPVIETAHTLQLPVAFFTTGQEVPDDIEPATARRLAWMLMQPMH